MVQLLRAPTSMPDIEHARSGTIRHSRSARLSDVLLSELGHFFRVVGGRGDTVGGVVLLGMPFNFFFDEVVLA